MDISVYSFTAVMQRAEKMMNSGGSALTLTYYGAEQVMPHYNVMGVAKAALEAHASPPGRSLSLGFGVLLPIHSKTLLTAAEYQL